MMNKTPCLTKAYLQNIIDELKNNAIRLLEKNPAMPFSAFQSQCLHDSPLIQMDITSTVNDELTYELEQQLVSVPFVNDKITVHIIGAGTAGLLAAAILSLKGFFIKLYESRPKDKACLRYPNISFKDAETILKPLLGNTIYQRFFNYGGSLDGNTGKLRLSIGAFQDVLLDEISQHKNVQCYFNQKIDLSYLLRQHQHSVFILATGAHTTKQFQLQDKLNMVTFPEYKAFGRTALYIRESDDIHGYSRSEREGFHWRRDNKTVYSGKILSADLNRVAMQLGESQQQLKQQLLSWCSSDSVEYTFNFGNDTNLFLKDTSIDTPPVLQARYEVNPMIALHPLYTEKTNTILSLGDANGTPHPLAAIGTLKFMKNMEHLIYFLQNFERLQCHTLKANKNSLMRLNAKRYCLSALQNMKDVFWGNILSVLFSKIER